MQQKSFIWQVTGFVPFCCGQAIVPETVPPELELEDDELEPEVEEEVVPEDEEELELEEVLAPEEELVLLELAEDVVPDDEDPEPELEV